LPATVQFEIAIPAAGTRVLVADDDPDVRDALTLVLTAAGYEVTAVHSGRAALTQLCQGEPPGLVLVDLLMPDLNAWELIAEMRRREKLADIPVAGMTGLDSPLGFPLPEARMLRKPIDPKSLLALVGSLASPAPTRPPSRG
jgi:CheY-like chemotaxis protein